MTFYICKYPKMVPHQKGIQKRCDRVSLAPPVTAVNTCKAPGKAHAWNSRPCMQAFSTLSTHFLHSSRQATGFRFPWALPTPSTQGHIQAPSSGPCAWEACRGWGVCRLFHFKAVVYAPR